MSQKKLDRITDKVLADGASKAVSSPLKVIAGEPHRPLMIGDIEIPCYVLEDETRVLSQRGVFRGINATRGGPRGVSDLGAKMPRFASQKWLKPFIYNDLAMALKHPILFQTASGKLAYGYPATALVDICDAVMSAAAAGSTTDRQHAIVERANLLIRGFAKVGIIALVDEATGYQRLREERALATILEKFIANELQPWTRTFPFEFYEQICRLRGWPSIHAVRRPSVIGRYTNDFVYDRIAPGILDELKEKTPRFPSGTLRNKYFQWFTPDHGHPKLQQHLWAVVALMRAASSWDTFRRSLDRAFPKLNETIPFALDEPEE